MLAPKVDETLDEGVDERRVSSFRNALKLCNLGFGDTDGILFRYVVYLTESIWTGVDTCVLDVLVDALQAGARAILVAETDMAHGWSRLQAERNVSDWSDAVRHLKNVQTPASYFEAQGGVTSALFDDVIPFYKDRAFREVSIQCILEGLQRVVEN